MKHEHLRASSGANASVPNGTGTRLSLMQRPYARMLDHVAGALQSVVNHNDFEPIAGKVPRVKTARTRHARPVEVQNNNREHGLFGPGVIRLARMLLFQNFGPLCSK